MTTLPARPKCVFNLLWYDIVTGGAGYLGVQVADTVLESGADVVCLDVVQSPPEEPWSTFLSIGLF